MATYRECKTLKFPGSDIIYVITDDGKVAVSQGIENAGKVLCVGDDGSVTLIDSKNLKTEIPVELLKYVEQTLTEEQKTQARANIGAGTSNFDGNYNSLTNKPVLFSGDYNDLENKPAISSINVESTLSSSSTNPVQSKVIYAELQKKVAYSGGKNITTGADMNTYTTAGSYISASSSISKTLINAPINGSGFKMFVYDGYIPGRVTQFVTTNSNDIYFRQFNGTVWKEWSRLYHTTNPILLADLGITATATEINYMAGVTSNVQGQLDAKAESEHEHTLSEITDITASATALNYVDGVTSNIQSQLDGKASSAHTQAASTITAGTFAGIVKAGASSQTYSTSLLRNTKLVSADTPPSNNGEICWTYE